MRAAFLIAAATLISASAAFAAPAPPGDAEAGKAYFDRTCALCHSIVEKSKPLAPTLKGVAGQDIGRRASDYKYTAALANKGGRWTDANLEAFLTRPAAFAPGTGMLVSVAKEEDRANVIAYLKTLK